MSENFNEGRDGIDEMSVNERPAELSPQWGESAPKGGKAVLNRVLKDGAAVPLFLGQTLVNSLRDLGYNSTTSALCEHVDNAIQWGATEVRVYFRQKGKLGNYTISALVYDNGKGMAPNVLKVATSFGGSMVFDSRDGIGRYGMGMKAAALSMSPVMEVYSWQEPAAFYNMTLDVEEIGSIKKNLIELPDPTLQDQLPSEVADVLIRPMDFPKNPHESQTLLADSRVELAEKLGTSGTIIFMPACDRLTYKKAQTLVDHATKEMGRIYRRFIAKGVKLFVNNRLVEAFDPTYWMPEARHTQVEGITEKQSKLVGSWPIPVPVAEGSSTTTTITVRVFMLPVDEWSGLSRSVLKNQLHVFDDHAVSFMRNDREVQIGWESKLKLKKHHISQWLRVEIDFSGEADEGFGVAANKQGARLKEYVADAIIKHGEFSEAIAFARRSIQEAKAKRASLKDGPGINEAERRANDAEPFQGKPLPELTPEEQAAIEENLRGLAISLKREGETEDDAFERVKSSRYLTKTTHDEYWPFYHCDFKYGKVILTVNTAHPFFTQVWQPLSSLANATQATQDGDEDNIEVSADVGTTCREALVGIQAMLLSLARSQSLLSGQGTGSDAQKLFDTLRRNWSENLSTQLQTK
ncbi:MAG: ATP-binding protein [Planctomycetaceae bacterium]